MKPLISILMPAYNAGPWIAEALKSAIGQAWSNKEIIVVNDGSTDQTLEIARQFASKGVLVYDQPNQGAAAARNKAFSLSKGEYIQWLDADDLIAPDKIERQMQAFLDRPSKRTLLSCSWGAFYYRPSKARFSPSSLWCDLTPVEWLIRKMNNNCHMQTATWLVSREVTEAAGPWDTRLLGDDDGEYFCRVKLASNCIRFIPESKVYYRDVGWNRLSFIGKSKRKMEAQLLSMKLHVGYIRSLEDSERTRGACLKYLQKYMFDFIPESPEIVAQMQELAKTLGGKLDSPTSPTPYSIIEKFLGWGASKRAQLALPQLKASALRSWDKAMHLFGPEQTLI